MMRAMILAAGRGDRMRPLTDACPKPLLEAGGKPLIVWHLERLREAGFMDVVINHAHLGEMIERALGDGSRFGLRLHYSRESEALETAGGIRQALPLLSPTPEPSPFLVVNGDVACDADLAAVRAAGERLAADSDLAHLVMVPNPGHHPGGDFHTNGGRLSATGEPRLTFSGVGAYHPSLFLTVAPGEKAALGPLLRQAMATGRVSGAVHSGYWLDVGTPQRLAELDRHLRTAAEASARAG